MTSPHDDAFLDFPSEDERPTEQQHDASLVDLESPDGLFPGVDVRAVPPPAQNEIDVLVDAVSAGSRPRVMSESEPIVEANDAEPSGSALAQYELQWLRSVVFRSDALRYVAGFIGAFALGTVIAWSVLRSFDAPASVPRQQPAASASAPAAVAPVPAPPRVPEKEKAITVPAPPLPAPSVTARSAPQPTAVRGTPAPATAAETARSLPAIRKPQVGRALAPPAIAKAPETTAPAVDLSPTNIADKPALSLPPAAAVVAPPPVSAPPIAAPVGLSAVAVDRQAVLHTVNEYKQAYEAMDVGATAAVWPSVDRRALARAYSTLKSQDLELQDCTISIADTKATTRCRGTIEYVRRIGNPTPRTGYQDFVFTLHKLGSNWIIYDVSASQADVARR